MAKAPAKQKTHEIADPMTGEILPAELLAEMGQDIADGLAQEFKADDLLIPRITILQDLSPQVKEHKAEYVQGARPSMIYNSVNNALETALYFVPAKYHAPWVAWKPRPDGGLVSNDVDPSILTEENGFVEDGIDRYVGHMRPTPNEDPVKVEVIKTPEWLGIARGADGWVMPAAISFPATKSKVARKINSSIDLTEVEIQPNVFRKLPPFYHTFLLSTALESAGDNEWWGFTVVHEGYGGTDPRLRDKARELRKAFEEGRATVADQDEQA